jgi:hypothetical protein
MAEPVGAAAVKTTAHLMFHPFSLQQSAWCLWLPVEMPVVLPGGHFSIVDRMAAEVSSMSSRLPRSIF